MLTRLGDDIADDDLEKRRTSATPVDLATLIYTSGTTGRPKGCMLTHGNFMFELGVAVDELDELFAGENASTLLFLPLAHVFARIIQIGAVKARVRLGHSADITNLIADLQAFQPTFVLAVPRVFEKVFNTASQRATADGQGRIFDRAAETAIAYSRGLDAGRRPARRPRPARGVLRAGLRQAARRPRRPLRATPSPAAPPLGERLGHFYRGIGVTVLEGYGLTETTAALTVNLPDAPQDRHAWAARSPAPRCGSPRTASCCSAAGRSSPATGTTRRPPPRCSRPTAGSTPATSARSTTRASSASPVARRRSS